MSQSERYQKTCQKLARTCRSLACLIKRIGTADCLYNSWAWSKAQDKHGDQSEDYQKLQWQFFGLGFSNIFYIRMYFFLSSNDSMFYSFYSSTPTDSKVLQQLPKWLRKANIGITNGPVKESSNSSSQSNTSIHRYWPMRVSTQVIFMICFSGF